MVLISEQHSQEEKTGQYLIQGEGNRQTTPLTMLPSTSARITRSLIDSVDLIFINLI